MSFLYKISARAELTTGSLIALARKIPYADATMKKGLWKKHDMAGIELRGKILGVIGLGVIGYLVARKVKSAFNMRVLVYDPYIKPEKAVGVGAELTDLEILLKESDFVTVHVPLSRETYHMIGARGTNGFLKEFIEKSSEHGEIYVFRSAKDGSWRLGSDLDIVILLENGSSKEKLYELFWNLDRKYGTRILDAKCMHPPVIVLSKAWQKRIFRILNNSKTFWWIFEKLDIINGVLKRFAPRYRTLYSRWSVEAKNVEWLDGRTLEEDRGARARN